MATFRTKLICSSQLASNSQALSLTDYLGFGIGAAAQSQSSETIPRTTKSKGGSTNKRSKPTSPDTRTPSEPGIKKRLRARRNVSADEVEDGPDVPLAYTLIVESKLKEVLDLCDSIGIRYIEWDAAKSLSWALFSSSCSFTGTHQDAGGYCTYVICEAGAKHWIYVDPKETPAEITAAMKNLVAVLTDSKDTETISDHADLLSLILTPETMV